MLTYSITAYDIVTFLWSAVAFTGLAFVSYHYVSRYLVFKLKYKNIRSADIYQIDHLSSEDFSRLIPKIFEGLGYSIKMVAAKGPKQESIDFVLTKGDQKIAVVVKHTTPKTKVGGRGAVHAQNGAALYDCREALVVTNGFFTQKAKDFAEEYEVTLYERGKMLGLLSELRERKSRRSRYRSNQLRRVPQEQPA